MADMRFLIALASCVVLSAGDFAGLRQLEENNRMFQLRAELDRRGENFGEALLYRAIAMSRFGSEHEAIDHFRKFLATKPAPDLERKARYELSWALTRLGEYRQPATEIGAALRLTGASETSRADHRNVQRLLETLNGVARQTVEFGPPTRVQARRNPLGLWEVPVEVNSRRGEWMFDTGANYSTVSESEALRMGLAIREVSAHISDFVGADHPTRLAVAGELRFGSARLRNVVFLVLSDQSLFVSPLKYQMHGILGLPVIRALECVEVSAEGATSFGKCAAAARVAANLFFDRLNAIMQVGHSGNNVQMVLDTGAAATVLYPSILDSFAQWERDQLKGARATASVAAISEQAEADLIPLIRLEPAGRTVHLDRIGLFRKAPQGTTGRDGVLGIDALKGGFRIDFRDMRLTLN
jgi:predicted aspartyl protease